MWILEINNLTGRTHNYFDEYKGKYNEQIIYTNKILNIANKWVNVMEQILFTKRINGSTSHNIWLYMSFEWKRGKEKINK